MTDYIVSTGTTGQLMIRDTGTTVQFWMKAGPLTHKNGVPWRETKGVDVSAWQYFNYQDSGNWSLVHESAAITVSTYFKFEIGDSGTQGLGGPASVSMTAERGSIPDAPVIDTVTLVGPGQVRVQWHVGFNGGATIDQKQLGWGNDPSAAVQWGNSDLDTTFMTLQKGTTQFFWARTHNKYGYSRLSARRSIFVPDVPVRATTPKLSNVQQDRLTVSWSFPDDGGAPITQIQLSWGTTYTADDHVLTVSGSVYTLTNLPDAAAIGVKVRALNSVGWSAWSPVASATTLLKPGSYVNVNGTWYPAAAYVNNNGVWRRVRPLVSMFGSWEPTG